MAIRFTTAADEAQALFGCREPHLIKQYAAYLEAGFTDDDLMLVCDQYDSLFGKQAQDGHVYAPQTNLRLKSEVNEYFWRLDPT